MTNVARGTSKRALRDSLLDWMSSKADTFDGFTYSWYRDWVLEQGIAPLTKAEFTWWVWRFSKLNFFFPLRLRSNRVGPTSVDSGYTWYDWEPHPAYEGDFDLRG